MESMSPFEMTHQGFLEANATLRRLNQTLEQQVREVQAARTAAEAAEQRARFLAEANMRLDATLDYSSRLAIVAHLAVPDLADYCLVDAVEESGEVCRVEAAAADPAKEALLRDLPRRRRPSTGTRRWGCARVSPDRPFGTLAGRFRHAPGGASPSTTSSAGWLRQLGPPVRHDRACCRRAGRTIAVMTLLAAESGRCYGPEELALAEDFARRAAITLDNARLYHRSPGSGAAQG